MVTAGGVLKVIIEDPDSAIAKGDFNVGRTPLNGGIPLLNDHSRSPLGIAAVNNPISDLQIQMPYFFHYFYRIGNYKNLSPQSTQRTSRSERDQIIQKTKFKKVRCFLGLSIFIILCVLRALGG
jgi:hypothetical protein